MTSVTQRVTDDLDAIEAMAREAAFTGIAPVLAELESWVGEPSAALLRLRHAVEGHDPIRVASAIAELRTELSAREHRQAHPGPGDGP